MAYPDDIYLPAQYKSIGFVETINPYNINWDLNWSFTFALTGIEHGFTTFLTGTPSSLSGYPGQYLGYLQTNDFYILSEAGETITDENGDPVLWDNGSRNLLCIAFDSTGKFALPIGENTGVDLSATKPNSLIIRNHLNDVVFNERLSSLSTEFFLASSKPNFQTLRFRLCNAGRFLHIEYRKNEDISYSSLTSIQINIPVNDYTVAYPGLTFCSPISSITTPSTLFIKNFHTQGNTKPPTYTIHNSNVVSLTANLYTSISGISATPI